MDGHGLGLVSMVSSGRLLTLLGTKITWPYSGNIVLVLTPSPLQIQLILQMALRAPLSLAADGIQSSVDGPRFGVIHIGSSQAPSHPSLQVWGSHLNVYFMFCNNHPTPYKAPNLVLSSFYIFVTLCADPFSLILYPTFTVCAFWCFLSANVCHALSFPYII